MTHEFCPGSAAVREPKPETIYCTGCGSELEIWTDERMVRCRHCGTPVMKDRGASCLDWCMMARQCVGDAVYDKYLEGKAAVPAPPFALTIARAVGGGESRSPSARRHASSALPYSPQRSPSIPSVFA